MESVPRTCKDWYERRIVPYREMIPWTYWMWKKDRDWKWTWQTRGICPHVQHKEVMYFLEMKGSQRRSGNHTIFMSCVAGSLSLSYLILLGWPSCTIKSDSVSPSPAESTCYDGSPESLGKGRRFRLLHAKCQNIWLTGTYLKPI